MTTSEIILVQPITSVTGAFIRMLPLGVLYAASGIVRDGFTVHILDTRISPASAEADLERLINRHTRIIGFSVMSGVSITESIRLSRMVKARHPDIAVVWGGPHPTFSPHDVLQEASIDIIIRGYGAEPFRKLARRLLQAPDSVAFELIDGLSWRNESGRTIHNETAPSFEFIDYREIPYHLIPDFSAYRHIDENETVFPMYSVMGCPYQCAFCSSPAVYARLDRKWVPLPASEVVAHIAMVQERFGATMIYFIDDDSFVDLQHVEAIIDGIKERGIQVKLGFRGARINEILAMDDGFLRKLADAGTASMHIGVESGCNRLLSLMKKNITVDQILMANRKLAQHPEITAYYNFIVGFPTETLDETKATRDLILQLIDENPRCIVIPLNKPRPLPGTELYDLALLHGYRPPVNLKEWETYELEASDYNPAWMTPQHNQFVRMMFLSMYFIDGKIFKMTAKGSIKYSFIKLLAWLYKPLALFRFRHGLYQLLIEDRVYGFLKRFL
ncbi:MAG: B12-binding domain-containing radical SAM protein [Geobacter sp.]|nr:B12-binding domain-containing radical SAM protein [Geobacter sp.]